MISFAHLRLTIGPLQPQNGVLWHRVFYEWLARFLKSPGT